MLTICGKWKDFVYVLDDKTGVCKLHRKESGIDYIERVNKKCNSFKLGVVYGFENRNSILSLPYLYYTYILRDRYNNGVFISMKLVFRIIPKFKILMLEFECEDEYIIFLDVMVSRKSYRDIHIDTESNDLFTVIGVSDLSQSAGIVIPEEMLFYMMRLYNTPDGVKNVFSAFDGYLSSKMQFYNENGEVYNFCGYSDIVESKWGNFEC